MRHVVAVTALVAAGSFLACSGSGAPDTSDAGGSDADTRRDARSESGRDARASDDVTGDAPATPYNAPPAPPLGGIRVANWSATAPPIDFCLAPHGTTKWQGPMLAAAGPQDAGAYGDGSAAGLAFSDGGVTGLGYPGVTSYFYMAPGHYDARFVAAGSPECNVPVVAPDAETLPELAKEGVLTIGLFGGAGQDAGAAGPKVVGFTDDATLPPSSVIGLGRFAVRFINAAPRVPAADFGTGPPGVFMGGYLSMFAGVVYGQTGNADESTFAPPYLDDNGYLFASAITESSFSASVLVNQNPVILVTGPTTVGAGAVVTVVLLGSGSPASDGGSQGGSLQLLQCEDNAGTLSISGDCKVISP